MATTLYAQISDLREVLESTDDGVGTPFQLEDEALQQALAAASVRVSIAYGQVMDSSTPQAVPPETFLPLTLDLAVFFAWRSYLKGKVMPADHPAFIAYQDANNILQAAREGKIRLDPNPQGGVGAEAGMVINRIPNVFSPDDSNTTVNPYTGYLESDIPYGSWGPRGDRSLSAGPVYQG